jgi:hypothetical protein
VFIDRRHNLVGHRAQSAGLEPRAVERQIINRHGDFF